MNTAPFIILYSVVVAHKTIARAVQAFRSNGLKIRITQEVIARSESPAEMKRLLKQKVHEQRNVCGICGEPFTDMKDIVPDHKLPKGMGSAWRDDHPDNIQAAHRRCNLEKGSRRLN